RGVTRRLSAVTTAHCSRLALPTRFWHLRLQQQNSVTRRPRKHSGVATANCSRLALSRRSFNPRSTATERRGYNEYSRLALLAEPELYAKNTRGEPLTRH